MDFQDHIARFFPLLVNVGVLILTIRVHNRIIREIEDVHHEEDVPHQYGRLVIILSQSKEILVALTLVLDELFNRLTQKSVRIIGHLLDSSTHTFPQARPPFALPLGARLFASRKKRQSKAHHHGGRPQLVYQELAEGGCS